MTIVQKYCEKASIYLLSNNKMDEQLNRQQDDDERNYDDDEHHHNHKKEAEKDERRQPTVSKTGESVNYGYHPIIDFFRLVINMMALKTMMIMIMIIEMIRIMG